ncbi:MAG: hypothetical protein ACRDRL_24190, partial [Sciscionella sp.]
MSASGSTARIDRTLTATREGTDALTARIETLIDPTFLTEMGWDPVSSVMFPPDGHRLVVRYVCRVEGCSTTATGARRICKSCQSRLAELGLDDDGISSLPVSDRRSRGPGWCSVAGCGREWVSAPVGICAAHLDQQESLGVSPAELLAHPLTVPLEACGNCQVASCPRQRRHPDGRYCAAHQIRLRSARRHSSSLDEGHWRRTEAPISVGGQVSLRGLEPLVVAQVLFGMQQRCRVEGVQTKEADLRCVCDDLRRQLVGSVAELTIADNCSLGFTGLAHSLTAHARRALATPDSEVAGDQWDLAVFGHAGT